MPIPVSETKATRSAEAPRLGRTTAARAANTLSRDTRVIVRCVVKPQTLALGTSEISAPRKPRTRRGSHSVLSEHGAHKNTRRESTARENTVVMDVDIATFEARAEEAERRLATLELKISEGATVPAAPAGDAAAGDEFKKKFYDQLVALRLELGKSRVERAAMVKQAVEDKAKIEQLEEANGKMKYRITHLVKAVRGEMEKKYPEAKNVDR